MPFGVKGLSRHRTGASKRGVSLGSLSPKSKYTGMRRFRRRQHYGMHSIRMEIFDEDITALVAKGYLEPNERENLSAVARSAEGFLNDALKDLV
jgi:hypothetical protein